MVATTAPAEPYHIKLYNLPQRVEGGIKVHSAEGDRVYLFDHLDGMYANCQIEGTEDTIMLHAATPLVELGNDEYKIEGEAEIHEEDAAPESEEE